VIAEALRDSLYREVKSRSAFPTLLSGPLRAGKCDVPGIFVADRA
jgi:hypothetical protein